MRIFWSIILILFISVLRGQVDFNLELVAQVPNEQALSDVWGYVAEDGTEYAIIGTRTSTEIYSLADPSDPQLVFSTVGASSIWRDIKTLGKYIYVTADDGDDGITIINMTEAPDNITSIMVQPLVNDTPIQKCHNLYIDTNSQIMFLAGCNTNRGVLAFDITSDPLNPQLINIVSETYAHDVFVRDNKVFASEIFAGEFAIYDIENIMEPFKLGSAQTTTFFTHNAWSSEDNQYVYTTDERPNGTVDAFDISDPENPVKVDVFVPSAIQNKEVIPHNTHWHNDFLITSWYDYGIVISDVSNPEKIIEVGHYNTGENPDCWGAYPFLPSGLILASDIANGLFVLQPNYVRASYLTGVVSDADSGDAIFDAEIEVLTDQTLLDHTDPKGEYLIGDLLTGEFEMITSHPDYMTDTTVITLVNGETNQVNITLKKQPTYRQIIRTVDKTTGDLITGAEILLRKKGRDVQMTTNQLGSIAGEFPAGDYTIVAGQWGYQYEVLNTAFEEDGSYVLELERGYEDDFIFDYGWNNKSFPNERSQWVRAMPIGTYFGDVAANPSEDVEGDIGEYCYVTGNGSGAVSDLDVDDGTSQLVSPPMDLSTFPDAALSFHPWFFNGGGSGADPNDTFKILITDGIDTVLMHSISEGTNGWAEAVRLNLSDFIALNDRIQIVFEASDDAEQRHLVEAAVDQFKVSLDGFVKTDNEFSAQKLWRVYPNPATSNVYIQQDSYDGKVFLQWFSLSGRMISSQSIQGGLGRIDVPDVGGIYLLKIIEESGRTEIKRLIIE
ncbi:choice-of-anchor B family protein [Portibacter marinus]|uniref:choice-of-anchor B family protein n=1 Tax=Portibacter marinus TaxID=2898660 RepID=UPI001F3BDED8|nr:choice-of-anchor B family protein [Portibacter marinus]